MAFSVNVRPPTADYVVGGPVSWWAYADATSEYVELPEVQKVHKRYHAANPEWVAFVPMGASWGPLEAMAAAAGYELAVATIATGQVLVAFDQRKESDPTMTNPMIKIR